jgi:CRISPR-associated protein (TIGR03986 family)
MPPHFAQKNHSGSQVSKPQLTAINAPYNFVPLADWVHCPDWADQVSHDLPFADGVSGHLDLTITTHTPLLVGSQQEKSSTNAPGEVKPFQMPDERYAIPGTSLKGMIRAVVEIASFSRMSLVDDIRYGLRDISGTRVKNAYAARVRNISTGFMRLGDNGLPVITPCSMVRLSHKTLEDWLDYKSPMFAPERSVAKKYQAWLQICDKKNIPANRIAFSPVDGEAQDLHRGTHQGVPVFTGQISLSTTKSGKKRDFVFYDEKPNQAFPLSLNEWGDFLYVHGDQATKDAAGMSWPGYWKKRYWDKQPVPIFYLQDRGKTRVGLAYMPRLVGDFSTHEMIEHTHSSHLQGQSKGDWDFAETLFGTVGEKSDVCLKGRVSFGHAVSNNAKLPVPKAPTILNGPKATYFPNYVRQQADPKTWRLTGHSYATCIYTSEHPKPEIRGWKRYPVRETATVQPLTDEQKTNKKLQSILHPLKEGTTFTGRVFFHNLKPEELGALLWVIEWGGENRFKHSLGMGKPFGFGQISLVVTGYEFLHNQPVNQTEKPQQYREQFVAYMQRISKDKWQQSPQMLALLGMSNPANVSKFKGKLEHMRLEPKKRINDFVDAKQQAFVLAEYPREQLQSSPDSITPKQTDAPLKWPNVEIKLTPGNGELSATYDGKTALLGGDASKRLRDNLPEDIQKRLKNKKLLKNCTIRVEPVGNGWKIVAILAVGETLIQQANS